MKQPSRNLAVGPVLWSSLSAARVRSELERSAWDRGVVITAAHYDSSSHLLSIIQLVIASGAGVALGSAVSDLSLPVQFFVGAVCGLIVFWLVPTLSAIVIATRAPAVQRDFARAEVRTADFRHRNQEAALRLQLSFHGLAGVQDRIDQYRKCEAIEDDRMRDRMLSESDPRIQISEWAIAAQGAFSETDVADRTREEFALNWGEKESANEIEDAYKRLLAIAESWARDHC